MQILVHSGNLFQCTEIQEEQIIKDVDSLLRLAFLKAINQHSNKSPALLLSREITFFFSYNEKRQIVYRRRKELEPLVLASDYIKG